MLIAVVGGTGTAGQVVVRELLSRGHQVRVLTRARDPEGLPEGTESRRADVASGDGLGVALTDVDVVIDCGNLMEIFSKRKLSAYFEQGTRNLLSAESQAGVSRHVVLSIVGIDDVSTPYYQAKLAQERLAAGGPVPSVIVRSTQFHDFPGQIMAQTRIGPFAFVPKFTIQPVATSEVARVLVDVALDRDSTQRIQIAGPNQMSLVDAVRRVSASTVQGPRVIPVPVPGKAGRAIRRRALTLPNGPTSGPDFESWLEQKLL